MLAGLCGSGRCSIVELDFLEDTGHLIDVQVTECGSLHQFEAYALSSRGLYDVGLQDRDFGPALALIA